MQKARICKDFFSACKKERDFALMKGSRVHHECLVVKLYSLFHIYVTLSVKYGLKSQNPIMR